MSSPVTSAELAQHLDTLRADMRQDQAITVAAVKEVRDLVASQNTKLNDVDSRVTVLETEKKTNRDVMARVPAFASAGWVIWSAVKAYLGK